MAKKTTKTFATAIRRALKSQNKYSSDVENSIQLAASALRDWHIADEGIEKLNSPTMVEISRYGEKTVLNPLFRLAQDSRKQASDLLKRLGLTITDVRSNTDALTDFDNLLDAE